MTLSSPYHASSAKPSCIPNLDGSFLDESLLIVWAALVGLQHWRFSGRVLVSNSFGAYLTHIVMVCCRVGFFC